MITLKQVTFVLDWTVVIVYEIREVVMHYLFNRSPENTFTLRFFNSLIHRGKWKNGKGKDSQENKNMQLQRNNKELRAAVKYMLFNFYH